MSTPGGGPAEAPAPDGPAVPRDAATVVLLRDGMDADAGPETWLLSRRTTLAFAAGMSVYPGGRVDATDGAVPLARPAGADEVAARYGIEPARAHALLVAAARETFEEAAVLFTVPPPPPGLTDARTALEAREIGFADLLAEHGLAVDGDAFCPFTRWITPEAEPRRYDTFFFLAALPDGARADDVTTESSAAGWVGARAAVAGESVLMPPTRVTLTEVGGHDRVADVVAAAAAAPGPLVAVEPVLHSGPDGAYVELPDGRTIPVGRPA